MEPNKETKLKIIENEMEIASGNIYVLEVRCRVHKKVGNAELLKQSTDEMQRQIIVLDELEKIKKELENDKS